jgi:hypothetical protein
MLDILSTMPDLPLPFPLGALQMSGPHALRHDTIEAVIQRRTPGNYALGHMVDGTFMVFYVGRSDRDLRAKLRQWVGAPSHSESFAAASRAPWGGPQQRFLPLVAPALLRVNSAADDGYTCFAFSYAASPTAAFQKQCRNYDDFGRSTRLDNRSAPQPPPESLLDAR